MPSGVQSILIDPQTGLRADDGCQAPVAVPYLRGHIDTLAWAPCSMAGRPQVDSPVDWFLNIFQRQQPGR